MHVYAYPCKFAMDFSWCTNFNSSHVFIHRSSWARGFQLKGNAAPMEKLSSSIGLLSMWSNECYSLSSPAISRLVCSRPIMPWHNSCNNCENCDIHICMFGHTLILQNLISKKQQNVSSKYKFSWHISSEKYKVNVWGQLSS